MDANGRASQVQVTSCLGMKFRAVSETATAPGRSGGLAVSALEALTLALGLELSSVGAVVESHAPWLAQTEHALAVNRSLYRLHT